MIFFSFLFFILIGLVSLIQGADIRKRFDKFELVFHPTLKTWYDARDYCNSYNDTDLVDLENREFGIALNQFLININAKDTDSYWLGGKESHSNEFIWEASGTTFKYDISDIKKDTDSYKSFCLTINDFSDKPELCDDRAYPICVKRDKCIKKKIFSLGGSQYEYHPNKKMTFRDAKYKVCENFLTIVSLKHLKRLKPFLDEIFECNKNITIWTQLKTFVIDKDFDELYFTILLWAKGNPKSDIDMNYVRLIKSDGEYKLENVGENAESNVICFTKNTFGMYEEYEPDIQLKCDTTEIYTFDEHEYHFVIEEKPYEEAKSYCETRKMQLLEVHTAEEYYRVLSLIVPYARSCYKKTRSYWLGTHSVNHEFRWNSDNSTVEYLGQPFNMRPTTYRSCLQIGSFYSKFQWKATFCDDTEQFICYKNTNWIFPTTTEVNFETENIDLSFKNHMNSKNDENKITSLLGNVHLKSLLILENNGSSNPEMNVKNTFNFITNFPNGTQLNATYNVLE